MEEHEIAELKAENEALKKQLSQTSRIENEQFIANLTKKGVLLPATKDKALELLNYASDYDQGGILNFSGGENLLGKLKDFLNHQPVIVHLNRELSAEDGGRYYEYAEHISAPKDAAQLDKAIRSYMNANGVDYKTAFNAIHQQGN